MLNVSNYIGLFTGLLIAGMGVYLLYADSIRLGLPTWLQLSAPIFFIGYGAIRFGLSLYHLLRHRRPSGSDMVLVVGVLLLNACRRGPEANLRVRFDYVGECASCPLARMDSILRVFFPLGVVAVSLDSAQVQVVLDLDTHYVRLDTVKHVLLGFGYEVDEEIAVDPILSPCCVSVSSEVASGSSLIVGVSPSEVHAEMSLLERELESELGESPSINLDTELNLEEDLGLEELDLESGLETEGLGLEELDLELELELDEPKAKGTPKPQPKK
ncbi:MAG: hypothetical protein RMK19_04565 [Bacteroidia bacterium]|nr:tetraspanin family protein [Bacteroidia bacterium]MDW8015265.1 hypothetical protein [Bacteroidia bacterium]